VIRKQRSGCLFLLSSSFLLSPALAQEEGAKVRAWEHETSDVAVDPRIRFGHLGNGLRWAWAVNAEPKHRSYLRLHVDAGSLAEEDDERGMAHFLEHMAFNGSEHFEPGTLVEWFQRHGMAFGADLNAHTAFSETVYDLDLPQSDGATIEEGLGVLRDFAFGLTLSAEEIEAEKGVVDGEERERDSPGYRLFVRQLEALYGETRLDDRIPIGVRETRRAFTPESVRAFYRKWYRPENMTLVLVGDLGDLDPEPLFEKHLGGAPRPEASPSVEPAAGTLSKLSHRACFFEPEIPSVTIQVESLRPWKEEPDVARERLEDVPISAARRMINLRFDELVKKEEAPFLGAETGSAEALRVVDGERLAIVCAPERWREALALAEQELRRAIEHGFQEAELAEVRADVLRALDEAVEREKTRSSTSLVNEILTAAEERYVPTAAATRRALLRPAFEKLTVEACREALVEAWSKGERSLVVSGNLDLGADAAKALEAAWEASRGVEVAKGAEIAVEAFAYASSPDEPGEIVERARIEDLEFESLRFANGVSVNLKRTDFKERQILLGGELGEGRLSLDPADAALAWMAEQVFEAGGLEAHTIDALRRLLAGKEVGVSVGVAADHFTFGGATTAEDLLLQCELVCAFLGAPGWRDDGFVQVRRQIPLIYESLARQHQGPVVTEFMSAVFSGDQRFAFFPRATLEAVELKAVRDWLSPFLADAPLEICLVGDLDVEEAVRIAARTFGRLPKRRALRAYEEHRKAPAPRSGIRQVHAIDTEVPKTLVLLAFPVPDGIEIETLRRLEFLTEVVNDRLRLEVRERLGVAYSPGAALRASRTFTGVGILVVEAMTDPGDVETLEEACLAVTDALAKDGVTAEEVDRLREPILKGHRDAQRRNGWWVGALSEARRRPESLEETRGLARFLETVTAEPLSEIAKGHLHRDKASIVVVHPRSAPPR